MWVCVCILFVLGCSYNDESDENQENVIYNVDNSCFTESTFKKYVYTSIGVNGHQGDGKSYEIEIKSKCKVSLTEYSVTVELFSADNVLLDTIDKKATVNIDAGSKLSVKKEVSKDTYEKIDKIKATWTGKSTQDPTSVLPKSINSISSSVSEIRLFMGDNLTFEYMVTPYDADEEVEISIEDTTIAEIDKNKTKDKKVGIKGKSVGTTKILFKVPGDENNSKTCSVSITVFDTEDVNYFREFNAKSVEKSLVTVYCKRYDKDWLGREKNVTYKKTEGVIIGSNGSRKYLVTHLSFYYGDSSQYVESYVIDCYGSRYTIKDVRLYNAQKLAVVRFDSSSDYFIPGINPYPKKGDYAIAPKGAPVISKIEKTVSMDLMAESFPTVPVFYHKCTSESKVDGQVIFDSNGKILGINGKYENDTAIAVSGEIIYRIYLGLLHSNVIT